MKKLSVLLILTVCLTSGSAISASPSLTGVHAGSLTQKKPGTMADKRPSLADKKPSLADKRPSLAAPERPSVSPDLRTGTLIISGKLSKHATNITEVALITVEMIALNSRDRYQKTFRTKTPFKRVLRDVPIGPGRVVVKYPQRASEGSVKTFTIRAGKTTSVVIN